MIRRSTGFLLGSLVILSGCVTFEQVDAGLATLKGKSLEQVIAVLGYPDAERSIAGKTIYTWGNRNTGSYTVPTTSTATTYINGQAIQTTVYGSSTRSYDYHCKVDAIVGKGGIVEDVQYDGNLGGCERYARLAPKKGG